MGELLKMYGHGLWKSVVSYPQNPGLFIEGWKLVIRPLAVESD